MKQEEKTCLQSVIPDRKNKILHSKLGRFRMLSLTIARAKLMRAVGNEGQATTLELSFERQFVSQLLGLS